MKNKKKKMKKRFKFNKKKKAALELSIGTIVVLVIAMSMLILGLILVKKIFFGATGSVDQLNEKVLDEMVKLFSEESSDIVIKAGSNQKVKIPAGTKDFGIAIGARTFDGSRASDDLKYKLELDTEAEKNCVKTLGKSRVERFFHQSIGKFLKFDKLQQDKGFARIQIDIPKGTPECSQKVYVYAKDGEESLGRDYFDIQIVKKGFF